MKNSHRFVFLLVCIVFLYYTLSSSAWAQTTSEQRAVWMNEDTSLDARLTSLKNSHLNTVYFGAWAGRTYGLQGAMDRIKAKGMDVHLWDANAFICAGQWGNCSNLNKTTWYARLPNGMSRKDWIGVDNYVDFGIPEVRDYAINAMVNYATNYNVDGIHYDYIRYEFMGNWSFSQTNVDAFQRQYGVSPEVVRGDRMPAFYGNFGANRVGTPSTATVLSRYHDGVPAILVNNYKNGQVLTFNLPAYRIYFKVTDTILQRAITRYGSSNIYVLSASINGGVHGPYNQTTRWLTYLGYTPRQTTVTGLATLPAGSLLVIPGVYSFTTDQITNMDTLLSQGGNIIFMDGPVITVNNSTTFKNMIGVSANAAYLSGKAMISMASGAATHPFVSSLDRGDNLSFAQASTIIDQWKTYMQGTVTAVVKGISDRVRVVKPNMKISAAVVPSETGEYLGSVHQNWPLWIQNGYIDYAVTMGYTFSSTAFTNRLTYLASNNLQNRVMLGLDAFEITSCSQNQILIDQIGMLRSRGFKGFAIFENSDITAAGQVPADCGIMNSLQTTLTSDVAPYYPTSQTVPSPTPTVKPGDANGDNRVDGVDYMVWRSHYNQNVSGPLNGDFDNSGRVDGVDYMIWRSNYGK